MMTNDYLEQNEIVRHSCHCGKEYKKRTGLWKHNTKCGLPNDNEKNINANVGKYIHIDKDCMLIRRCAPIK